MGGQRFSRVGGAFNGVRGGRGRSVETGGGRRDGLILVTRSEHTQGRVLTVGMGGAARGVFGTNGCTAVITTTPARRSW